MSTARSAGLSSVASTRGRSVQVLTSRLREAAPPAESGSPDAIRDAPVISEAVERAVGVEGLVVCAKPDVRVLRDEPEELLPGALLRASLGALGKLHLHELELPLPFVHEVRFERLELVEGDEVVLDPQGALRVRAVVVDHRFLQEFAV